MCLAFRDEQTVSSKFSALQMRISGLDVQLRDLVELVRA